MISSINLFVFIPQLIFSAQATEFHNNYSYADVGIFQVEPQRNQSRTTLEDQITPDSERVQKQYDAIIIGAGWSGLSAAKTLQQNGVNNFIILDAHDYIGGRSKTRRLYGNVFSEEGSVMLMGIGSNAIYKQVMKPYNVGNADFGNRLAMYRNGQKYGANQKFWKYYNGVYSAWDRYNVNKQSSFDTILNRYKREMKIQNKPVELAILDAAVEQAVRYEMAAETSKFSPFAGNMGSGLVGKNVVPRQGFSSLVDAYAESLLGNIELKATVTKVNYQKQIVQVTYTNKVGQTVNIKGKKVLSTIPVGVLKAGTVQFVPPFNKVGNAGKRKQTAINKLHPGQFEKVTLHWKGMKNNEVFWDKNVEFIVDVNSSEQGKFTYWNNFYFINGAPTLVGYLTGPYAKTVPNLTDNQIVNQATERLRSMFPNKNVSPPTHFFVTRWGAERFTRGLYAYAGKGAHKKIRNHLFQPLRNRLFFAGEATFEKYWGTTHGAFESGILAGNRMRKGL